MIRINRLEDITESNRLKMEMKRELKGYFREIAESIAGEEWETYSLEEIGEILIIEEDDAIDVLDEYGIMQGSNTNPPCTSRVRRKSNSR